MSVIMADGIGAVVFHNGILRIECVSAGADRKGHPSGTILIPAPQVNAVLKALIAATSEVEQQLRNQVKQAAVSRETGAAGAASAHAAEGKDEPGDKPSDKPR